MTDRRHFLAASTLTALSSGMVGAGLRTAHAQSPSAAYEKTWMTYAVNIEMIWSKLPVLERLDKVAEAGFTHYEFWPWRGKDIDAMLKKNQELGLTPVQFSVFWGITSPTKREIFLENVRLAIPVAQKLGVKMLCVVAGEVTEGLSIEEQDKAVIDSLKAGAELAAAAGITLILEPLNVLVDHPKQLVVTSEHAARIIKAVGSPNVRILFDCYHQQISEGNLTGNIRKYKDLIGYYQIADHPGRHEPSTGEVNYSNVMRAIHDTGYTGAIGLEMTAKGDTLAALNAVRGMDAAARR